MPVRIPHTLPAAATLTAENIFVMTEMRAQTQDIRPLKILILNLMPTKEATETQLLRMLGNTPLQVDPVLMTTTSYIPTHTTKEYLQAFYYTFDEIKDQKFDGLIITGAPIEKLPFEEVQYWQELTEIMDWAKTHVFSTLYICWGAQAGLYYHYGVQKYPLEDKLFGIYRHRVLQKNTQLMRGFDDVFNVPHSRYTEIRRKDIEETKVLDILVDSEEAGVYLVVSKDYKHVFVTGHCEYDEETLEKEYLRDIEEGLDICPPANYYPGGDTTQKPLLTWRAHGNLLFSNWLNCVYQETPYDLNAIKG